VLAAAKINLDLLITGRKDDGYHLLDSFVVFADVGDELTAELSDGLSLEISGPFSGDLQGSDDNLIIKAARLLCNEAGVPADIKFHLIKNLPVSSGIGGGSADAAAALKLTIEKLSLNVDEDKLNEIALKLGADVPVCLKSTACIMSGIGEEISEINLKSPAYLLLVNPGASVSTEEVFKHSHNLRSAFDEKRQIYTDEINFTFILDQLKESRNSLQLAACDIEVKITEVINEISQTEDVLISRMSGSGATCFGLYKTKESCQKAAKKIKDSHKKWWIVDSQFH